MAPKNMKVIIGKGSEVFSLEDARTFTSKYEAEVELLQIKLGFVYYNFHGKAYKTLSTNLVQKGLTA